MNPARLCEVLLESVGVGLAIVSPADLGIGYRNARFEEWFGLEGEDGARARRPGAERGRRGAARAHGAGAPLPLRQRGRRRAERAERLLLNIMPRKVYEEIRTFGVTTPQRFDEASTLMVDFVGIGRRRVYSLLAEASLPVAAAI